MQSTSHILMIRPVHFSFNEQTAVNNSFQVAGLSPNVQQKAQEEFDEFVIKLRGRGIDVVVIDDTPEPYTPDSIFPNNWISFHDDGTIVTYPMFAHNRRLERKPAVIESLEKQFVIHRKIDLSPYEERNRFLEGTGSMVLDRENRIAYACLSPRTDKMLLEEFCTSLGYLPVAFSALDQKGKQIYHTNVMMCVTDKYVVICLDSIPAAEERQRVVTTIEKSRKEIIEITADQVKQFAGNMLQVQNNEGTQFLVMSSRAFNALDEEQVSRLRNYNEIVHSSLDTIERNGGGSARCMMAEVYLPVR